MTRKTPGLGDLRAEFEVHVYGLGYSFVEVFVPEAGLRSRQFVLPTPTDGELTCLTVGMSMAPLDDPGRLLRPLALLGRRVASELVRQFVFRAYVGDVEDDFKIWQNKAYVDRPVLAKGDGPIALYRRWATQFYSELQETSRLQTAADGPKGA